MRRKTTKLASPSNNPTLLLKVYGAAKYFEKISDEYAVATDGYRAKLYEFAERCYEVGVGFKDRLDVFARFKENSFWDGARQKPKDDKVMKAVVMFAMKAMSKHHMSRVTKTASVLESLAKQGVKATEVANRLKEGGGIEKMYAALSPNRNNKARVPDDLEMLVPGLAEGDQEDGGAEDEETSEGTPAGDGDWPAVVKDSDLNADLLDDPIGKSPAMPRGATGGPTITDFGGIASPPKHQSLRAIFDPNKHLLIDMSTSGVSIEEALNMGELRIMAVVQPADDSGYRAVKADTVTKAALIAGLRKKLDNDEADD